MMNGISVNLLDINYEELKPYIIDAYIHVFGSEYEDIIKSRVNNTIVFHYNDPDRLESYITSLHSNKSVELYVKLLKKGNIITNKDLLLTDEQIVAKYIDLIVLILGNGSLSNMSETTLMNFDENNIDLQSYLMAIEILGNNFKTLDEFESHISSAIGSQDLKRINEIKNIFKEIVEEYNEWMIDILPYEEYVENEKERKKKARGEVLDTIFTYAYGKLPSINKASLSSLPKWKQLAALVGDEESDISYICGFDANNMAIIKQDKNLYLAYPVINLQKNYLKCMGIEIPKNLDNIRNENEVKQWLDFLQTPEVKKHIPTNAYLGFVNFIKSTHLEAYKKRLIKDRKDYLNIIKRCKNISLKLSEDIYEMLRNKNICVSTNGGLKDDEFISIMYFDPATYGLASYALLHEFGHVIEQNGDKLGFESGCFSLNPYDKRFRKYEKFNELINDIFAIEAREYLEKNGNYLIESEEVSIKDVRDYNTSFELKKLLEPFISNYRKYIIKAKINSDPSQLYKYIGKSNYEELVDIVNKLQYKFGINATYDKEYYNEVKRLNELYKKIDTYYQSQLSSLSEEETSLSM